MKRLSDENIIEAALNVYNKHLSKLDNRSDIAEGTHQRVQEIIQEVQERSTRIILRFEDKNH